MEVIAVVVPETSGFRRTGVVAESVAAVDLEVTVCGEDCVASAAGVLCFVMDAVSFHLILIWEGFVTI